MDFKTIIENNNKSHIISKPELSKLISQAKQIHAQNFPNSVHFERSVFINWTCGIADCKYCYLSTKPKKDEHALRSPASILAEVLICKLMGWEVGYITGGLRVESTEYLIDLLNKIEKVQGKQTMMNFGPYSNQEVNQLKPHLTGMGSAIESFDEELHKYICPSKPLPALMSFLSHLQENNMGKLITIILGMGEKMEDVETVIQKVNEYQINTVQLCFLKPQENTIFENVPSPDPDYMAWWIAKLRIACPKLIIKTALVRDRISDLSLYLDAGINAFSRFMVFKDFNTIYAKQLEEECKKANRTLKGNFTKVPEINLEEELNNIDLDEDLKEKIKVKAEQYLKKLNNSIQIKKMT